MIVPLAISSTFLLVFLVLKLSRIGRRENEAPPGPPTIPLLGNLHMFPREHAPQQFTTWARQYGDIYSLIFGSKMVLVLSSAKAVNEFMDKRSANTADRPSLYIADQVTGGLHLALARYAETWRILRRTAHTILTPQAAANQIPIQRAEAIQLMYDLLHTPQQFYTHIRRTSMSGTLSVLYGKRCPRNGSGDLADFATALSLWEKSQSTSSAPLVDFIPILRYIPDRWAPWASICQKIRELQRTLYLRWLDECENGVKSGKEVGCFMEEVIKRREEFGLTREMMIYLGGTLMEGGTDTATSFLQTLVLALVAFPDAQRKAHEEMDRVVGAGGVPTLDDFPNLPYIQAIITEVHRFRPGIPLAAPHMTVAADEYRGYVIPAGTTLFMNVWGIYHDPVAFEDPDSFIPDRYLTSEYGTKPGYDDSAFRHTFAFGSGRRLCPGVHVANNVLMLNVMNLIWSFNFEKAINPDTKQTIPVDIHDYHDGIVSKPNPFKCSITPRSARHAEIINEEFRNAINTFLPFEQKLDKEDKDWIAEARAQIS